MRPLVGAVAVAFALVALVLLFSGARHPAAPFLAGLMLLVSVVALVVLAWLSTQRLGG